MEIKGSPPSVTTTPTPGGSATNAHPLRALSGLHVGQTVAATVAESSNGRFALLQIQNHPLRVETPAPLLTGQRIAVEILQLAPQPVLRLQSLPATAQGGSEAIDSALRQALPKQSGLAPLLANLNLLSQSQQSATALAPALLASIKRVISNLPQRSQATTSSGLKEALQRSGLFLEHSLAHRPPPSAARLEDLKASLLQLLAQSRAAARQAPRPAVTALSPVIPQTAIPLPPRRTQQTAPQPGAAPTLAGVTNLFQIAGEIGRQTEGALARLLLQQLASLPQQDQNSPLWTFELPLHHQGRSDLFQLTLQQEGRGGQEGQRPRHSVMLSFELEGLGPIHIKVNHAAEQISATLWAEEQATATLVRQEVKELRRRLEKAGVVTGQLHCHHGRPPEPATADTRPTVLDIRV